MVPSDPDRNSLVSQPACTARNLAIPPSARTLPESSFAGPFEGRFQTNKRNRSRTLFLVFHSPTTTFLLRRAPRQGQRSRPSEKLPTGLAPRTGVVLTLPLPFGILQGYPPGFLPPDRRARRILSASGSPLRLARYSFAPQRPFLGCRRIIVPESFAFRLARCSNRTSWNQLHYGSSVSGCQD